LTVNSRGPNVGARLADHCLLFGYEAIAHLEETMRPSRMILSQDDAGFLRRFGWIFGVVGVALASAVAGFLLAAL
jgi:hypothetical protein